MPTIFHSLKRKLHEQLINTLELEVLGNMEAPAARGYLRQILYGMVDKEGLPLSATERERVVSNVIDEMLGLGPLEPLLKDETISDILVNGTHGVYVERRGRLELTPIRFDDDNHVLRIIQRIISKMGRRLDESSPMVDARLADGSRINAIIPPLAVDGPILSIRRFMDASLDIESLVDGGTLTQPMADLLKAAVDGRLNLMISGGTGAGKTTLLNAISAFIGPTERIVTIEDAAELRLRQTHIVRLETRLANLEGRGEIRQRQLVVNALRMRPDRIIVGEVRGEEALDMLQAMNTGHDGSLTTIHANSPRDALSRLETMIAMANLNLSDRAVRQQIASAITVVVQIARFADGSRKVTGISEITGMEGMVITMQEIFLFERAGYDANGNVIGTFRATGIRPKFSERLSAAGIELPFDMFKVDGTKN